MSTRGRLSNRATAAPSRTQRTLAALCGTLLAGALLMVSGGNAIAALAAGPADQAHATQHAEP